MFILALIIGIFIGFSIAYLITAVMVARSNDHGDSKGTFDNFAQHPLNVTQEKNHIPKPRL